MNSSHMHTQIIALCKCYSSGSGSISSSRHTGFGGVMCQLDASSLRSQQALSHTHQRRDTTQQPELDTSR